MCNSVNLREKLDKITKEWTPGIVGELNGQHVKLAKISGDFVWHTHDDADELFLVLSGNLDIELRDKTVHLSDGEFFIVPRGVEHRPVAHGLVELLLFEPAGTVNTGDAGGERTVEPEWL